VRTSNFNRRFESLCHVYQNLAWNSLVLKEISSQCIGWINTLSSGLFSIDSRFRFEALFFDDRTTTRVQHLFGRRFSIAHESYRANNLWSEDKFVAKSPVECDVLDTPRIEIVIHLEPEICWK
jgi:hypothetical protein